MKQLFISLVIGLFGSRMEVHAVEKIRETCIDAESKKAVPFATIYVQSINLITDADSSGLFEIEIAPDDTLLVTSIGYREQKISASELKKVFVIPLQPLPVQLREVFIGNRKLMTVGFMKGKKKFGMNSDDCVRYEMATRINIPDNVKQFQIKSISIGGIGFNAENPVRIHIYSVGKYGEPHGEILKKDIVIKENNSRSNVLVIDVEDQEIFLNDKQFFVGVQWIADSINRERIKIKKKHFIGPGIYCSHNISSTVTYTRSLNRRVGWMLQTDGFVYPYDYDKMPAKIESPLNMLVSCDILY
ncbi:MAG TPA: carboxypeptidase-like regulatory domain-containing protein [Lacibacter sp.]|nr:carboxypeptidase-like regulatory domain-containing protein [Lacibacter sp.]